MKQPNQAGIVTRSKDYHSFNNSTQLTSDNSLYPNLKKFDDFYKDKKNLENEMFVYQPPRIDKNKYQVDFEKIRFYPKNSSVNKAISPPINPKYNLSSPQISSEDLAYYLKFIDYYEKQIGCENIYLKGVHSVQAKALDLLKQCEYNINVAMSKILFPVMDQMNCLDSINKDKSLYLSSALNDLIGANNAEKEQWAEYIQMRLDKTIRMNELDILIENGKKMKIEIPP